MANNYIQLSNNAKKLGYSLSAFRKAWKDAVDYVNYLSKDENTEAHLRSYIYNSQPGWETVYAPDHLRVSYRDLTPGCISQEVAFPISMWD